jgi:hypothetical protein
VAEHTHSQVMEIIREGLADAEHAIRSHPENTVRAYEFGLRAFLEGQADSLEPADLAATEITVEEFHAIQQYLLAMSFMSAWYRRHGDKERRDKAAQSAATLVGGTGLDPIIVFKKLLQYEQLWRRTLREAGVGRSRFGCLPALLLVGLPSLFRS